MVAIRVKGAWLAVTSIVDLSTLVAENAGFTRIVVVLKAAQDMLLRVALQSARDAHKTRANSGAHAQLGATPAARQIWRSNCASSRCGDEHCAHHRDGAAHVKRVTTQPMPDRPLSRWNQPHLLDLPRTAGDLVRRTHD